MNQRKPTRPHHAHSNRAGSRHQRLSPHAAHADDRWYFRVHLRTAETAELGRQATIQAQEPKDQQENSCPNHQNQEGSKAWKRPTHIPRQEEYQCASQAKRRAERIEHGLCVSCSNTVITGETRCPSCAERHRESRRGSDAKRQDIAGHTATTD